MDMCGLQVWRLSRRGSDLRPKDGFMNTAATPEMDSAEPLGFPIPANVHAEKVVSVRHYTDRLFSFRITRPQSLRFRSGEFVMIGLPNAEKPIFRAYSVASPDWDDELEFFSIKVPDGPLTQHLQKVQPGDTVIMRQKPTGTLVLDALTPARRLFMISTGTGIAPFASLLRDPDTYEKFERVVLTHTCRDRAELVYGQELVAGLQTDPLIGELTHGRVTLYNSTTREDSPRMGRITALIGSGKFYADLGLEKLDPETDRVMICGSMHMLKDVKELVEAMGFREGSLSQPASFVVERAFVG
jgi:ferredoxin--NADP+ reductase